MSLFKCLLTGFYLYVCFFIESVFLYSQRADLCTYLCTMYVYMYVGPYFTIAHSKEVY